jgi:hypothetical protein
MGDSMSTIINATTTNGVVIEPDNSGSLVLQTNSGTTALTIDTSQRAAFVAGTAAAPAITTTGDTNTGIFFSAADTIDFAEGGAAVGQFDSSANFKFNSGYGSVATAYGCRAWVNFNGTGTVAIRASGNVTSITDNGTGDYTVNFTNAMPDVNYVGVFGPVIRSGPDANCMVRYGNAMGTYALTTTTYRFGTGEIGAGFTGQDAVAVQASFFR